MLLAVSASWGAITANIDQILKDPDATVVRVTYADGVAIKVQKEYRLTSFDLETFKSIVRGDIDRLAAVGNVNQKIAVGPFDPASTPLTDQEKAKAKFVTDLFTLRQMQKAITLGLMTINDQEYVDQVALVNSEFLPEYLSFL